jgi:hypothetical protein
MVSDVIEHPANVVGPPAASLHLVGLQPQVLDLPHLVLVPPLALVAEQLPTTIRIWDVLAAWRASEHELAVTSADNPEWPRIHADLVGLRAAYHRMFRERLNAPDRELRNRIYDVDRLAMTDVRNPERP